MIAGTKVIVIGGGPTHRDGDYHGFNIGLEVVFTGEVYPLNPEWSRFEATDGSTTWLKPTHYKVLEVPTTGEVPDLTLPSKTIYAVTNSFGEVVYTKHNRDKARERKTLLGGKAKGFSLFAYTAQKEIR